MAADRARLNLLRSSRYSANTVSAYASDWADFSGWCERAGKTALPADPETVALYLSHLVPLLKVSTMGRRLAAISSKHGAAGLSVPVTPMVRHVLSSARRSSGQRVRRKAAISIGELSSISGLLADEDTLRSTRDRAVLLLGFAGGFRRSELAGLDLADIEIGSVHVAISLGRSKTDQEGKGAELALPRAKNAGLCCVRALADWIVERGHWPGPLFCQIGRGDVLVRSRMQGYEVWYALKHGAERAGLDASKFGAHSLRAGFVTASTEAGADVFDIMAITRHRSIVNLEKYVRKSVTRYPLAAAL